MRLRPNEQQVIREASLRYFGARPRLFGSQLNDLKRGVEARLHMVADIAMSLPLEEALRHRNRHV